MGDPSSGGYTISVCNQPTRSTQPPAIAEPSTSFGWVKGGNVTFAGWQVTLCDPVWHASSHSGEAILRLPLRCVYLCGCRRLLKMYSFVRVIHPAAGSVTFAVQLIQGIFSGAPLPSEIYTGRRCLALPRHYTPGTL